jgi:hypothetical protein
MRLDFSAADLHPIVVEVVHEVLRQHLDHEHQLQANRIGYTEGEAAALLGVQQYVLRDCRLRGEISARKVGKRFVYSRQELLKFLAAKDDSQSRRSRQGGNQDARL